MFNRNIYNNHYYSVADIIDTLSQVTLFVYVFVFELYSKSRNPIPVILANPEQIVQRSVCVPERFHR